MQKAVNSNSTFLWICFAVLLLIEAVAVFLPPLYSEGRDSPTLRSQSQLKQIWLSFMLYDDSLTFDLPNVDHVKAWNLLHRQKIQTDPQIYSLQRKGRGVTYPLREEDNDYLFFGSLSASIHRPPEPVEVLAFLKPTKMEQGNKIPVLFNDGVVKIVSVKNKTAAAVVRAAYKEQFKTPYSKALLAQAERWDVEQKNQKIRKLLWK